MSRPPAAPNRTRRTLARPTGLGTVSSVNKPEDDLADSLSALKISTNAATKRVLPRSLVATATRKGLVGRESGGGGTKNAGTTTTTTARENKPVARTTSTSTKPIASTSKLTSARTPPATAHERSRTAMKVVNSSISSLASLNKAGYKATSTGSTPKKREEIERSAGEAMMALEELRGLVRGGEINNRLVDVEKAAGGVVGHLVEMEMYLTALPLLASMRTSILSLYTPLPPVPPSAITNRLLPPKSLLYYAHLLAIPLPPTSFFDPPTLSEALGVLSISEDDLVQGNTSTTSPPLASKVGRPSAEELIPLVLLIQQYTLGCLFRSELLNTEERGKRVMAVAKYLLPEELEGESEGPLAWRRLWDRMVLERDGEGKVAKEGGEAEEVKRRRLDGFMNSMFGTMTKGLIGAEEYAAPHILLRLRTLSLLYFLTCIPSTTPPSSQTITRLTSFYDNVRRTLLLFGRSCEANTTKKIGSSAISEGVKSSFETIVKALEEKGLVGCAGNRDAEGGDLLEKNWIALCEIVLRVARNAEDQILVERISDLMGSSGSAIESTTKKIEPAVQASQLSAKILAVVGLLEKFAKGEGEDSSIAEHLRRTIIFLPVLTRLRSQALSSSTHNKIDSSIERLRYIAARATKGGKRAHQLMTLAGEEKQEESEAGMELRRLLDALTEHVESLHRASNGKVPVDGLNALYSGAIDSLLILAYSRLILDDRTTYTSAYASLERTLPLIEATYSSSSPPTITSLSLTNHSAIRNLASAYYTIGGMLFNASKPDAATRFVRRACEISQVVVEQYGREVSPFDSEEGGEERESKRDSVAEIGKYLSKRWELMALIGVAIGQKKAAWDAYVLALLSVPYETLTKLAANASNTPISTLITRETYSTVFKLVQRITKLGVLDLLLPPHEASLKDRLEGKNFDREVTAVVLELQLAVLDNLPDKVEVQSVTRVVLDALLETYTETEYPLRRARTLTRCLRQECLLGHSTEESKVDIKVNQTLCSQEDLVRDVALRHFASQYSATAHIWIGFRAHRQQGPAAGDATFSAARQALRLFRTALDGEIGGSPSAPKRSPPAKSGEAAARAPPPTASKSRAGPAKAIGGASKMAFKTPVTSRTLPGRSKAVLVTPPSRTLLSAERKGATAKDQLLSNKMPLLDDAERTYSQLSTMANLLGALGYSLLRMSYLKFLRRLSSRIGSDSDEAFVLVSAQLGREYVRLGKLYRAGVVFGQASARLQLCAQNDKPLSLPTQVEYNSLYAEYLAVLGAVDRSAHAYAEALSLADKILQEEEGLSTSAKILQRTQLLQRAARASTVMSIMLQRRGDLTGSMGPALQAARLGTRALHNISRLVPADVVSVLEDSKTFTAAPTEANTPLPDHPAPTARRKSPNVALIGASASMGWELVESLASALLRVATLHALRGNPKSASYYSNIAGELGHDLGSTRVVARSLTLRAEVDLSSRLYQQAQDHLDEADRILGSNTACPEAIESRRLRADLHNRNSLSEDAHRIYLEAQKSLDTFTRAANDGETVQSRQVSSVPLTLIGADEEFLMISHLKETPSPNRRKVLSPAQASPLHTGGRALESGDQVLPALQAYLLRMRVELLRLDNKHDESRALLRMLPRFGVSEDNKAEEYQLQATIQFQDALVRFASDPVLGMLPESVLSMPPLALPMAKVTASPRSGQSLSSSLGDIDTLLANALAYSISRAPPNKLRDISLRTASLRALQSSIGKTSKRGVSTVATTLDLGLAVTLRREMLDAIDHKIMSSTIKDDLVWPTSDHKPPSHSMDDSALRFWLSTRERYKSESIETPLTDPSLSTLLPSDWTVMSAHLSPECDALVLVRHRRDTEPLVFKLPLDRVARREGEEGQESFTYDFALAELNAIIATSNEGCSRAKMVSGKEDRASWWSERKELDDRLRILTEQIETVWLGAFKAAFLDVRGRSDEAFSMFKATVEKVLKRSIVRTQDKKSTRFKLDDNVLGCLAALPSHATDADIEDLFYFMMESFQFTGVPVAYDEIDVDQVVVDLRSALDVFHASESEQSPSPLDDDHTFLLLDKTLQPFPWESIPCLRSRSVSRLPSLSFLKDRLDLAAARDVTSSRPHEIVVDASRTSFVLNPGGDLKATQATFEPWLKQMTTSAGWSGIIGRGPSPEEMKAALANKDLFLYFGHGGAEQYIPSQAVRHLSRCATTFLWGCSSGHLKDLGDYDPVGTPYHYMIAGCPALVANLWDVTDKDIDKLSKAVFQTVGLMESGTPTVPETRRPTLTKAVASSREGCNLRYLNGAAPVVYGVPVRFSRLSLLG